MSDEPIYATLVAKWQRIVHDLAELAAVETVADIAYVYGEGWGQ